MNLTIRERVVLFNILPEKGNFLTMRAIHGLRMALPLSSEERERGGYVQEGETSHWTNDFEADLPIDVEQTGIIVDVLRELDKSKSLTVDHVSLYEKFIGRGA